MHSKLIVCRHTYAWSYIQLWRTCYKYNDHHQVVYRKYWSTWDIVKSGISEDAELGWLNTKKKLFHFWSQFKPRKKWGNLSKQIVKSTQEINFLLFFAVTQIPAFLREFYEHFKFNDSTDISCKIVKKCILN